MADKTKKSYVIPPAFRFASEPGQVPSKKRMRTLGQVQVLSKLGARNAEGAATLNLGKLSGKPQAIADPSTKGPSGPTTPMLSPGSVIRGMGLDVSESAGWTKFLERAVSSSQNEVVFRKAVTEQLQASGLKGEVRKALFQRSLDHWRTIKKSESPRLFVRLQKSQGGPFIGPRGGKWSDAQHTIPWDPVSAKGIAPKVEVGLSWDSPGGVRKIVAISEGRALIQTGSNKIGAQILPVSEIPAEMVFDKKQAVSRAKTQVARQAKEQEMEAKRAEREDFGGYENTLSPKAKAVAVRVLNSKVLRGREMVTQKAVVKEMVQAGAKPGVVAGKPALMKPDGSFVFQKDLSKYAMNYAEFLIAGQSRKSMKLPIPDGLSKAMFIGPRGGKWADAAHTIPWTPPKGKKIHVIDMSGDSSLEAQAAPEAAMDTPEKRAEYVRRLFAADPTFAQMQVKVKADRISLEVSTFTQGSPDNEGARDLLNRAQARMADRWQQGEFPGMTLRVQKKEGSRYQGKYLSVTAARDELVGIGVEITIVPSQPNDTQPDPAKAVNEAGWERMPEETEPEPEPELTTGQSDYEERQEEKRERLTIRSDKARQRSEAAQGRSHAISERFAGGQPILVGHHSEARARRDRDHMDSAMRTAIDEGKKAEHLAYRAESVGEGGISSDDPEAVVKLLQKVAKLESRRDEMKNVNKVYSKHKGDLLAVQKELGLSDQAMAGLAQSAKDDYRKNPKPIPTYMLTNIGANIRTTKKRIERLRAEGKVRAMIQAEQEAAPEDAPDRAGQAPDGTDYSIVENPDENRVQLLFSGKPSAEVRTQIKREGFRWSPRQKAWQRMLNQAGRNAVERLHTGWAPEKPAEEIKIPAKPEKAGEDKPPESAGAVVKRYRYGMSLRPPGFATAPKGYELESHPEFKHGVVTYDRPLTKKEIDSFELVPILAPEQLSGYVDATVAELGDYAAEYLEMADEDPPGFAAIVRQAFQRESGPAHVADYDAVVSEVQQRLQGIVDQEGKALSLESGTSKLLSIEPSGMGVATPQVLTVPAGKKVAAKKEKKAKAKQADLFRAMQVLTLDDLIKGEARGGKYHRRIPKKSGKGYHYIYSPKDYDKRKDAHGNGEEAGRAYLSKKVMSYVESHGSKGCGPDSMADLVKKFGAKGVAQALREGKKGGTLAYKKGKFSLCKQKG